MRCIAHQCRLQCHHQRYTTSRRKSGGERLGGLTRAATYAYMQPARGNKNINRQHRTMMMFKKKMLGARFVSVCIRVCVLNRPHAHEPFLRHDKKAAYFCIGYVISYLMMITHADVQGMSDSLLVKRFFNKNKAGIS